MCAPFETWDPGTARPFDLVVAATSWHWIDPELRYRRAWDLVRPGGHLAFWTASHVFPTGGDPFFAEIQAVYDEIGEGLPPDAVWATPGELSDQRSEIEATGLFADVVTRHVDWEVVYDADDYLALLDTFSGHIAMQSWQRRRLDGESRRRLAERPPAGPFAGTGEPSCTSPGGCPDPGPRAPSHGLRWRVEVLPSNTCSVQSARRR